MNKLAAWAFALLSTILVVEYAFGPWDIILAVFNVAVFSRFLTRAKLADNVVTFMFFIYIVLSQHVIAAFQIQSYGFTYNTSDTPFNYSDFEALAIFTNRVLACLSMVVLVFMPGKKRVVAKPFVTRKTVPIQLFAVALLVAYFCTFLRFYFGISDMDYGVILPFHLNGLIDEYNKTIMPVIIAVYIYDRLSKNRTISPSYSLMVVLWVLLETIARVSKGVIVTTFLPSIALLFLMEWFTKKRVLTYFLPLILVFSIAYPVVEALRRQDGISLDYIHGAYMEQKNDKTTKSNPYIRMFISGTDYMKVHNVVDGDPSLFYFGRSPVLVYMRGTAAYMTYEIDGYPIGSHQSSGTTGIVDPLLWGGYGFCYVIIVILGILSVKVDRSLFLHKKVLYYIVAILFMKTIIIQRSISFFIDNLVVSAVGALLIELLIIVIYYKIAGHKYIMAKNPLAKYSN